MFLMKIKVGLDREMDYTVVGLDLLYCTSMGSCIITLISFVCIGSDDITVHREFTVEKYFLAG